ASELRARGLRPSSGLRAELPVRSPVRQRQEMAEFWRPHIRGIWRLACRRHFDGADRLSPELHVQRIGPAGAQQWPDSESGGACPDIAWRGTWRSVVFAVELRGAGRSDVWQCWPKPD